MKKIIGDFKESSFMSSGAETRLQWAEVKMGGEQRRASEEIQWQRERGEGWIEGYENRLEKSVPLWLFSSGWVGLTEQESIKM